MRALDTRTDTIFVTVSPAQARQIAMAVRLDLTARWEQHWLHPLAPREEISAARSLLNLCTDELEMLQWGEPTGDVDLRADRRRLGELAQNLHEGGKECLAAGEPPDVRRQGVEMMAAARVLRMALAGA